MEDVVISSLHHKNLVLCCGLVPRRNRPWWNPRRLERSPNECWPGTKKPRGRKLNGKLVFFWCFRFSDTKRKETGSRQKVSRASRICCHVGIVVRRTCRMEWTTPFCLRRSPKSMPSKRQKDKKGVVPRSVGYQGPDHRGLDPWIPQNHRPRGSPEERIEDGRAVTGQLCMGGQS